MRIARIDHSGGARAAVIDGESVKVLAPDMRLGLGMCKGKDFANTLGPWIVTADELEPYRDRDRLDLELWAELNGNQLGRDSLANMAWSFEELRARPRRGPAESLR